jgi:hypothetical protein
MVNPSVVGLIACILTLLSGTALAWGDLGHRIICEIAF